MNHLATAGLLLSLPTVPGTSFAHAAIPSAESRRVLERCGGDEARLAALPDTAWAPMASSGPKHAALRRALGEPMPHGGTMVLVYGAGGDLATTEYSIVLTRGEGGGWRGTAVGRSRIWIKDAPWTVTPPRDWMLPPAAARRLDTLLDDPCLRAEPTGPSPDQAPPVGAMGNTVEIQTAAGARTSFAFAGAAQGLTRELIALVTPPRQ